MHETETLHLGDYLVLKELGLGMLGRVFLAKHRFLKKIFTIKILPEELAENLPFIRRFETEVALLASLDHPQIMKIHNATLLDGKYCLICDGVEGVNLAEFLKEKGQLWEEDIFEIVKQVAEALDYAHEKNINDEPLAHRNLKLSSILIEKRDEKLLVKVADFGLSHIVGIGSLLSKTYQVLWERMAGEENQPLYESFIENYAFLAPEQKRKPQSSREGDAKADIYAFGILLYYLLVGNFPEGIFSMPSEINKELKKNWDPLIKACLQFDPELRPIYLSKEIESLEIKPFLKPQELVRPDYDIDPSTVFQTDKTVNIYTPKQKEFKQIDPLLTKMVIVNGGTYLRGSNQGGRDEMPRHPVSLSPFAIDIHPVTNEQFIRFLEVMGGEKEGNNNDILRLRDSRLNRVGGKLFIESGYAKHPVVGVTWYGALAYAKWIGKRLPTEAEWEIAACGGIESNIFPTGEQIERSQANFFSSDTTAVMSYPPNEYGLYDMAGNVYEWCMDWYGYHYYETSVQEPENPKGPAQGVYRALRGGCWKSLKEDLRVSHRHRNNPGSVNGTYGFRCATDVI